MTKKTKLLAFNNFMNNFTHVQDSDNDYWQTTRPIGEIWLEILKDLDLYKKV